MSPHRDSSRTLLDLCDLSFCMALFLDLSLCENAYDLALQFYLCVFYYKLTSRSVRAVHLSVSAYGFFHCVIYYGLTSRSVPVVYLSVSPYGYYLCVLGSFP